MTEIEQWKSVVGWNGYYEISSLGNVRKHNGKPIAQTIARNGYAYFQARRNGERKCLKVNVEVARAFLGERPNGMVCDHIDRNPLNNRLSNLRYVTYAENARNSDHWDRCVNYYKAASTPRLKRLYRVTFHENGRKVGFGSYATEMEASNVANEIRSRILAGERVGSIKRARGRNGLAVSDAMLP